MMERWFRWHHGTVMDPKLRVVARKASQPISVVVAVWAAMMERASEATPRGSISGWDPETLAAGLELDEKDVLAIHRAMQGRTLDGDELRAWRKRQPRREDDSTERVREWRQRGSQPEDVAGQGETQGNAMKRSETPEESRVEEKRGPLPPSVVSPPSKAATNGGRGKAKRGIGLPESWKPSAAHVQLALDEGVDLRREEAKFRDHAAANGRTLKDWDAGFRTWLRNAREFAKANRARNGESTPDPWALKPGDLDP